MFLGCYSTKRIIKELTSSRSVSSISPSTRRPTTAAAAPDAEAEAEAEAEAISFGFPPQSSLVAEMTPPCYPFPAAKLQEKVQLDVHGRKRKLPGGRDVDLKSCELLSMVQFSCSVDHPEQRNSPVSCWPVQRLFRR